jgi:hypothetical protein
MADIGEPSRRHRVVPLEHPIHDTPREPVAPPLPERRVTEPSPLPESEPVDNRSTCLDFIRQFASWRFLYGARLVASYCCPR